MIAARRPDPQLRRRPHPCPAWHTVDQALPAIGDRASRRQEVVDSVLEMADRLVHTQYDFIRKVVDSAGKSLSGSTPAK
jgi:hypothetical protein